MKIFRLVLGVLVMTLAGCNGCIEVGAGPSPVGVGTDDGGAGTVTCERDDDCPFGQACRGGECKPNDQGVHDNGCENDDDCPADQQCATATGRCVPRAGNPDPPDPVPSGCTDGTTRQCGTKVGACTFGVERCVGSVWTGTCEGGTAPVAERCDDVDNDCDGEVDEDWPELEMACEDGVGACRQVGVQRCTTAGDAATCSVTALDPTGRTELCDNGIDDDCDGDTDEGFVLGAACEDGVGACYRAGVTVCSEDRRTAVCSAVAPAPEPADLCGNGLDDDCDGETDEGFDALGTPCEDGVGACYRAGLVVCRDDLLAAICSASAAPAAPADTCGNGLDDDCDGATDEGFETLGMPCQDGVGACFRAGQVVCRDDLLAVVCSVSASAPAPADLCGNSLDDDCDGTTDEGFADLGIPCTRGQGACRADGTMVCTSDRLGLQCSVTEGTAAPADLCGNNLDDDCDGLVDEGFADLGTPCTRGQGACRRDGTMVCTADALALVCSVTEGAAAPDELCGNAVDDDCDGQVDEGFGARGDPCFDGVGACRRDGVMLCTSNLLALECSVTAAPAAPAELCGNAVDDDCDGSTDEGFATVGNACSPGVGACQRNGQIVCTGDRLGVECSVTAAPPGAAELCGNNVDDDCNGQVDEGFAGTIGTACFVGTAPCRTQGTWQCTADRTNKFCELPVVGAEVCNGVDDDLDMCTDEDFDVGDACTAGVGACRQTGTKVCATTTTTQCSVSGGTPAPAELCGNNVDDDCDSSTDEGFDVGASCTAGVGACRQTGTKVCTPNRLATQCSVTGGTPGPAELCGNSVDDDCDNATDEGFDVGTSCNVGNGICRRTGVKVCSGDRLSTVCGATAGTSDPRGELCGNTLDDDCDGSTDEGYDVGTACSAGVGICRQTGVKQCRADLLGTQCSVTGGTPGPAELCGNTLDDDCDGSTDEGFDVGTACSAGVGACRQTGVKQCRADRLATVCSVSGGTPGPAELCGNSVDDDCDGSTDEGFVTGTSCTVGVGACLRNGTNVCTADGLGTRCSATAGTPGANELCGNGVDDDCDGSTDEGYVTGGSCSVGVGACVRNGTTVCTADGLGTRCSATSGTPGPNELCGNGVDDDCDGSTDEGYVTGTSCSVGVGACLRTGTTVCTADGLGTRCSATAGSPGANELCGNGVDDDCDGSTDEGFPNLGNACTSGVGACQASGMFTCSADRLSTTCSASPLPPGPAELCGNSIDDDCDGATDEGFAGLGSACSVGSGACARTGNYVCSTDRLGITCNATPGVPTTEQCDNIDNDCNAVTDNGCDDDGDSYCDAAMTIVGTPTICPSTTSAALRDCVDDDPTINPGASEICGDARDQDCDGNNNNGCGCGPVMDADFDGVRSIACGGTDCDDTNGAVFPGATERCDGADNNCNGVLDEGFDADNDTYTTCGTVRPGGGLDPAWVDCDDTQSARHPFACELCANASGTVACGAPNDRGNNVDEDCDGYADETCAPCDSVDRDGDTISECDGDCAPTDPNVAPGRAEVCDGKDTDCNQRTRDNCDVGDTCNWPGYPTSTDPTPDLCEPRLICVESLAGNGRGTGVFTCTSFCNYSPTGAGLGDGCEPTQTCSSRLTPTTNLHGCQVNSEIGTLPSGTNCSDDANCRSDYCFRDGRFTGNVKYCTDLCGNDSYCGSGTTCQAVPGDTAYCWRTLSVQTLNVGDTCTTVGSDYRCKGGSRSCVAGPSGNICSAVCCEDDDCPSGYHCGLVGPDSPNPRGGYDTVPMCYPDASGSHDRVAGAACTSNGQCVSEFCDVNLGTCVDLCCNDGDCPVGLRCDPVIMERSNMHQSFTRACVNLTPSAPLKAR